MSDVREPVERHGVLVHSAKVAPLLRARHDGDSLAAIERQLTAFGVFELPALPTGLYAAVARPVAGSEQLNYRACWVRDSVHVAAVAWEAGDLAAAGRAARALAGWFLLQGPRFDAHIEGRADPDDSMQRPHVRLDGQRLAEIDAWWPHIQNDALGYGLWFLSRAALAGLHPLDAGLAAVLRRFPRYFAARRFWEEADSGHWEERRQRSSSSIGTVTAGLVALRGLARARPELDDGGLTALCARLIEAGRAALAAALPGESVGHADPRADRRADAATLFLCWPLRVVGAEQTQAIVQRVGSELLGPWGVRRYVGDSYWMAGYKRLFDEETRTSGFRETAQRDAFLVPGTEAQWCLFDPVLSVIHGQRWLASGDPAARAAQEHHFNRALGQITGAQSPFGEGLCPESYWQPDPEDAGRRQPNDATPLLWTQALLGSAFRALRAGLPAG